VRAIPQAIDAIVNDVKVETLRADAIDEPAVERQHQREGEEIAANNPLHARGGGVQVVADGGERDVHHRRVHLRHERAEEDDRGHAHDGGIELRRARRRARHRHRSSATNASAVTTRP
jgi:hypothetical protein